MPGAVFVGFGFPCMASIIHRIPMGFIHIGGSPILFSFPGVQTHSFVPLTRTVIVPSTAISATVASLVTCSGPERRALVILGSSPLSVMYLPPGFGSSDTVSFRPVSSIAESPDRAKVWPELLLSKAATAIVVARKSLRVFIDLHLSRSAIFVCPQNQLKKLTHVHLLNFGLIASQRRDRSSR